MDVNRPPSRPLTPEEQAAMESFRERIHGLALRGGLTAQNVRSMVQAMRTHPDVGPDILQVLLDELHLLHEEAPGLQPFDLR
jgi:hypothetical protein